jgi:Na+/H+-translocating membrane pyrophosphatase
MRFARVMLRIQLAGIAVGAVALVCLLGFGVHPHQVGHAFLIAACYVAVTGIGMFFMQQAWRAQARRAAANAAGQAGGARTTDNAGVLGAPGVPKGLRSLRRAWISLIILGAGMLIAFLVLVVHYEGPALAL